MIDMEVVVVGTIIQVVLVHLLSSMDQIMLVWGFKKDLNKLKDSLIMIADLLHLLSVADVEQSSKEAVILWLGRVENIAFEADVILDEFSDELRREEKQISKVMRFFPTCSNKIPFSKNMGRRITDVNIQLKLINKKAKGFGQTKPIELVPLPPVEQQTSGSFFFEPNVVGREDDVSKIVEILITAPPEETCSIVPIVGTRGIGKTAVAQEIYHNKRVGVHFTERIWVSVSGNLNVMSLLKMILEKLSCEEYVEVIATKEVVLDKILKHLEGKRYLLVLDDVWNEKFENWDGFMNLISRINSVKGNCIVITTRKETISSVAKTLPTQRLKSLSTEECWSIVKSKALPSLDAQTNFQRIGKCISQRCDGLPLAAKALGSLLHGKSIDEWLFILENQRINIGLDHENHVHKTFKLIYDHLPSLQKKGFARENVIMFLMAVEYLQAGRGGDLGIVGNRFFNYLLQNVLFRNVERGKLPHWIGDLSFLGSNGSGDDIGATIHVVLQNVLSVSFKEVKVMFGFEKELTKLENSLILIKQVMHDPEVRRTNNEAIQSWLEHLEVAAFEADAVLYEFIYEHFRQVVTKQSREAKKLISYLSSAYTNVAFNRKMSRKINTLNDKLERMGMQVDTLGLEMSVIRSIQPPFWGF